MMSWNLGLCGMRVFSQKNLTLLIAAQTALLFLDPKQWSKLSYEYLTKLLLTYLLLKDKPRIDVRDQVYYRQQSMSYKRYFGFFEVGSDLGIVEIFTMEQRLDLVIEILKF